MIEERFYIDDDMKMNEVKTFIRQNMPTARFKCNPYKVFDKWEVNITYEIEDINKLSKFFETLTYH